MTQKMQVYYSPLVLQHPTGAGVFEAAPSPLFERDEIHPENAERIRKMRSVLHRGPIATLLDWHEAAPASDDAILRFHQTDYLASLRAIPHNESRRVTATTVFGPGSLAAVAAAAGQAIAAVDHVWQGGGRLALVQEGGYALSYAALCLHATLAGVLLQEQTIPDPIAFLPEARDGISSRIDEIERRWRRAAAR